MRQRDPSCEVFVHDRRNVVAVDAAVVDPLGQADQVPREPVAADVRRLPGRLLVELLAEPFEERAPVPRAAGIVLSVGAGKEEWLLDRGCIGPGFDPTEVVVVLELQPAQTLLTEDRVGDVGGERGMSTAVRAPDQEDPGARPLSPELPEAGLDLIGQTAAR